MMQNMEKLICAIKYSVVYMVIYCLLVLLAIYYAPDKLLAGVGIVGGIYVIVNAFCIKYRRERLFVNGLISALAVLCLGVLIGECIELDGIISLGVAISIMDILSFTKYGKHTVNAKAMSNSNFMSKLIVYGKGKGDILIPTRGIGDYFFIFRLIQKERYKGFPATVFPFVCVAIWYGVLYYAK